MPKNMNKKPSELPMELMFGEKPETRFVNNLDSINVKLISSPQLHELTKYLPEFIRATWNPDVFALENLTDLERLKLVRDVFFQRTLPTAMETIGFVWQLDGISIQEATHILRYRNASFSADCSADKFWHKRDALVPGAIQNCSKEYEEFKEAVNKCMENYMNLINTEKVSINDARMILPRCLDTFYYMRMSFIDTLHFIQQRKDTQMQPETDNVMSYQMYLEILKRYPILNGLVNFDEPNNQYLNVVEEHGRMYQPEEKNDKFDWHPDDFMFKGTRKDMNGTYDAGEYKFEQHHEFYMKEFKKQEALNDEFLRQFYGVDTEELDEVDVRRKPWKNNMGEELVGDKFKVRRD